MSSQPFANGARFSRSPFGGGMDYTKVLLLGVVYSGVIVLAHWLAYLIRFEFQPSLESQTHFWRTLQWSLPVELVFLFVFGQFHSLLSYFSFPDTNRIILACAATSLISLAIWYGTGGAHAPPRSIIILSFLLDAAGLISVRVLFRKLRERQRSGGNNGKTPRWIVIVGAGDVGANLAKEMKLRRDLDMHPVAFCDDDPTKWNTQVHGVPVVGRPELLAEGKIRADEAVIAMPSATGKRVREVVQVFNKAHIRFETVPSLEQMVNGAVRVSQIRPVEIEDLLGRERVCLETDKIRSLVEGKIVMVTGAGGTIGGELCRQIIAYNPLRLLMVERCEVQLFQIEQELLDRGSGALIVPLVADVLNDERMQGIFERFRPQLVFHGAAHKHVPMMEHQPFEAFRNNTIGTKHVAKHSVEFGVERFVLISTDKAINPTNAMGASKRLAELYLQALQKELLCRDQRSGVSGQRSAVRDPNPEPKTQDSEPTVSAEPRLAQPKLKLMAVRFGNVLGSSGSVIPTFKKQIAAGGPVTVTHPEVTRYFMTVSEAVGLVLQSATQGQGGEIFVLDMGRPVKVLDVALQLIELSGLKPEFDIEIKFTGLRPGEKLYEEVSHNTENMVATDHPKIMRFVGEPLPFETLREGLLGIHEKAATMDANQVKLEFQKLVPEYRPYLTTV